MRKPARVTVTLLVAVAYLGVALWHLRAVVPDPSTRLPESFQASERFAQLGRLDQAMVVGVVAGNAHRLVTRPWALRDEGQCHPLPRAYTLGEHMFGEGLLAALPFALTRDPILSFNLVLLLMLWIPALSMYALALHFTGSAPAAFVAGLLFAFEPSRLRDAAHPFIHGDLWTPLGLLFLHLTFARGRARNAFACALFFSLAVLESFYALLASTLVTLVYGVYAAVRHRAAVRRWLPPLLVSLLVVGALAAYVLLPYIEARKTWDVPSRPGSLFMPLWAYLPGQSGFLGWTLLLLVALAIADRVRRRRPEEDEDPRLAFLVAALLVLWCSVASVPLLGVSLPSPLLLAKELLPGLQSVRALSTVGRGAVLAFALLAAYGVLALGERLGRRGAVVVAVLATVSILAERWAPGLAMVTFGTPLELAAWEARPADADLALLSRHARGAVLDLPLPDNRVPAARLPAANYLLLHAFDPRPTAACYNSFSSPLLDQVADLARALPEAHAADALAGLGFETVVLHLGGVSPRGPGIFSGRVRNDPVIAQRLELLDGTPSLMVFRLRTPLPVTSDPGVLAPQPGQPGDVTPSAAVAVEPGRRDVELRLHNAGERTFVHPRPIAPLEVEATWRDSSGDVVAKERVKLLLPLAVAPRRSATAHAGVTVPAAPGLYSLTIDAPAARRGGATATIEVRVADGAAPEAASRSGAARVAGAPRVDTHGAPW